MVQERQVHLREVGGVSRPVVHLHIDVGMYVAMPEGGITTVVPDTLQVGWCMDAGIQVGSYGKVSSVLEIERFQEKPVLALLVLVRGIIELNQVLCCHCRGTSQLQADPVHQGAVCLLVV